MFSARSLRCAAGVDAGIPRLVGCGNPLSAAAAPGAEAVSTGKDQVQELGQFDPRLPLPAVPLAPRCRGDSQARGAGALAPRRLSPLLALEVTAIARTSTDLEQISQPRSADEPREPA